MKTKIQLIGLVLALASPVFADTGAAQYSTAGVAYSTTTNYAIIGNSSITGGQPIITGLFATSDALATTTGKVQFYRSTNFWSAPAGLTNVTVTNYIAVNAGTGVGSTNGINVGSPLVIQHMNPLSWECTFASSVIANPYSTNITVTPSGNYTNYIVAITTAVPPTNAVVPGDNIYLCSTNGAGLIPVGVGSISLLNSGGIYSGQRGKPLLMIIGGGTNGYISSASATYSNP